MLEKNVITSEINRSILIPIRDPNEIVVKIYIYIYTLEKQFFLTRLNREEKGADLDQKEDPRFDKIRCEEKEKRSPSRFLPIRSSRRGNECPPKLNLKKKLQIRDEETSFQWCLLRVDIWRYCDYLRELYLSKQQLCSEKLSISFPRGRE